MLRSLYAPLLVGPIEEKYDVRPPVAELTAGAGLKLKLTVMLVSAAICDSNLSISKRTEEEEAQVLQLT